MPQVSSPSSTDEPHLAASTAETRIAKALAHPVRARILKRLGQRVASPGELSDELDVPLGVVAYHVRMLCEYGCLELVRTEPRRGALQHFYRTTERAVFHADRWRDLPPGLRGELSGGTVAALIADLVAALESSALNDPDTVVSRTPLELDETGWRKLNRLLTRTHERALEIAAESAQRGGEERFATELGVLHFRRAAGPAR
jgi:DNA-binding transcriptional ArsR family regulator